MITNTFKSLMTKIQPNDYFIACKESRIENKTSFYGCFYLGPFEDNLTQTLANDLRRTLLAELPGLAITSISIEGVLHKFSNLPGMKETTLDLICNLQNIVLQKQKILSTKNILRPTKKTYVGFLKVNGPRIIKAKDLKLPAGLQCVDPNQYIATLAEDGFLNMKFNINEGKNFIKQKQYNLDVSMLKKRNILLQNFKKIITSTSPKGDALLSTVVEAKVDALRAKKSGRLSTKESATHLPTHHKGGMDYFLTSKNTNKYISNPIPLDAVFMPVTKINCIVEENNLYSDFNTDPINLSNIPLSSFKRTLSGGGSGAPTPSKKNLSLYNIYYSKEYFHPLKGTHYFPPWWKLNSIDFNLISQTALMYPSSLSITNTPALAPEVGLQKTESASEINVKNTFKFVVFKNLSNLLYFGLTSSNLPTRPSQESTLNPPPKSIVQSTKPPHKGSFDSHQQGGLDRYVSFSYMKNFLSTTNKIKKIANSSLVSIAPSFIQGSKPPLRGLEKAPSSPYGVGKSVYTVSTSPKGDALLSTVVEAKVEGAMYPLTLTSRASRLEKNPHPLLTGGSFYPFHQRWMDNSMDKGGLAQRAKTVFKINPINVINQQMYNLEYKNNLKLKPVRKKSHLIVEIWTNGSIHPRQALYYSFMFLSNNFLKLQTVKTLGSMFKSEIFYGNLKYSLLNNYKQNLKSSYKPHPQRWNTIERGTKNLRGRSTIMGVSESKNLTTGLTTIQNKIKQNNNTHIVYKKNKIKNCLQASLKAPIGILNISLRSYTALKKAGIVSLADLIKCSKTDLLKIKNIGIKALVEIETNLAQVGLHLKIE